MPYCAHSRAAVRVNARSAIEKIERHRERSRAERFDRATRGCEASGKSRWSVALVDGARGDCDVEATCGELERYGPTDPSTRPRHHGNAPRAQTPGSREVIVEPPGDVRLSSSGLSAGADDRLRDDTEQVEIIPGVNCAELLLSLGLPTEEVVRVLMREVHLTRAEATTTVSVVRRRSRALVAAGSGETRTSLQPS